MLGRGGCLCSARQQLLSRGDKRRSDITNVSKNKQQAPIMCYSGSLERRPYVGLRAMSRHALQIADKPPLPQPCQSAVVKQLSSY